MALKTITKGAYLWNLSQSWRPPADNDVSEFNGKTTNITGCGFFSVHRILNLSREASITLFPFFAVAFIAAIVSIVVFIAVVRGMIHPLRFTVWVKLVITISLVRLFGFLCIGWYHSSYVSLISSPPNAGQLVALDRTWITEPHLCENWDNGIWNQTWISESHLCENWDNGIWNLTWITEPHLCENWDNGIWNLTWITEPHLCENWDNGIWNLTWISVDK